MATIYDLKPRFQALLRPLLRWLADMGVTANQVTIAALILSLLTGLLIYLNPTSSVVLLLVPLVLFVRMALNAIDGMLAREFNMKSALGAVLNELGDVISDAALYLPLALVPGLSAGWVVILVLLGVMAEMTGVVAVQIGAERRYDGPFGKSDRAFVFGALCFFMGLGVDPQPWVDYLFPLLAILGVLTILNRGRRALESLQ